MPNIFEEQAKQRFQRAKAFMDKAHALLLQDDLVSRSALADAVSAVKNSLQGYLLYKVATMTSGMPRQDWQEVAASNRMPDLLRASMEAGLGLNGLDREIRKLNDERNSRTHDDPLRRVDPDQARQAVEIALLLNRRIADAMKGANIRVPTPSMPISAAQAAPVLAKVGIGRGVIAPAAAPARISAAVATTSAPSAAVARPVAVAPQAPAPIEDVTPDEGDDEAVDAQAVEDAWGRRRLRRWLTRAGTGALLLLVGAAAGILGLAALSGAGLTAVLGGAHQPTALAATAPTATESLLPINASLSAGALLVGAPVCQGGRSTLALRNLGALPISYSAGSPDAASALFSATADGAGQATMSGALDVGATTTLYVASPVGAHRFHLVIVATGGAVQVPAGPC